jgi:phospholipase C
VPWRWYSFDPGTLRLADAHYLLGHHRRFGYFSKNGLPWQAVLDLTVNQKLPSFLGDAAAGTLPPVSWIDPAFTNFNPLGFPVNDDHPPADIKDGQDLVLAAYDALASSPQWETSLLVIVYDEHGGFYDHVPPPRAADDEPEMFGRYGVRVPAIIVSPWVEPRTVSSTVFDHTSIIKTILLRFCPQALSEQQPTRATRAGLGPQYPGLRVAPGQPSRGTPDPQHATPRPAPRCAAAASHGQSCINRNQPAPARSAGTSRPPAQRPAEKHSCRDPRAAKTGTSTERTLGEVRMSLEADLQAENWATTRSAL